MTRRVSRGWIASLVAVTSCSSLTGRPLSEPPAVCTTTFFFWSNCEAATGVPYSLSRPTFSIQQKTLAGGKKARPVYEIVVGYEADESRRFEVGMTRGFLTNDTFELSLDPNGRAVAMNSARADQTGKTIAAVLTTAAAAAGVAARVAGVMSETKGLPVAKELCDWIDTRLAPLSADVENQKKQLIEDAAKPDRNQNDINRRRADLLKRASEINQLIKDDQCNAEERKVGVAPPSVCVSIDDACKKLLTEIIKKSSRVLARDVCTTQRYFELAEYSMDSSAPSTWAQIGELKKLASSTEPAENLTAQFKALRKNVDVALVEAVIAEANQTPDRKQKREVLHRAIDTYKQTLQLVLDADQRLNGRALGDRRQLLLNFVAKRPPTGRGQGEDYAKYRSELDAVDLALQDVLPKAKAQEEASVDATDLTGNIDTKVMTERYRRHLTDQEMKHRIDLAQVEVGIGCAKAVVIADPELPAEAGAK